MLERLRQMLAPQDGKIGLWRGAEVDEGMQIAEGVFRNKRFAVDADAADGFGDPGGVATEQLVVLWRAQMAHQAQLDDELVDQFLRFCFGDKPVVQITLYIDIKEC